MELRLTETNTVGFFAKKGIARGTILFVERALVQYDQTGDFDFAKVYHDDQLSQDGQFELCNRCSDTLQLQNINFLRLSQLSPSLNGLPWVDVFINNRYKHHKAAKYMSVNELYQIIS